jgi:hypothetical protein
MTPIIAFTGFKQSGKTTASRHLQDKYRYQLHNFKTGLIKELKEKFPDLLGYYQHLYGVTEVDDLFVTKEAPIRALMQNYGAEVRRAEDEDYWVLQWKLGLVEHMMADRRAIVADDVRFVNEAEAIKAWGGTIIRIIRTDITSGGEHVSETEMLEIVPDDTIEVGPGEYGKLYEELDRILCGNAITAEKS